jgi:hypothetical protein
MDLTQQSQGPQQSHQQYRTRSFPAVLVTAYRVPSGLWKVLFPDGYEVVHLSDTVFHQLFWSDVDTPPTTPYPPTHPTPHPEPHPEPPTPPHPEPHPCQSVMVVCTRMVPQTVVYVFPQPGPPPPPPLPPPPPPPPPQVPQWSGSGQGTK